MGLTPKQARFIEEYFLNNMNASAAALKAGYKTRQSGAENLSNPVISEEIDRRLKAMHLGKTEVISRLSQHAAGTLAYFMNEAGEIDLTTPDAKEHFHLLKKVKRTAHKDGSVTIEIEVHDPQAALVHVGKYHKLFVEQVEHSGAADKPPIQFIWTDMADGDNSGHD